MRAGRGATPDETKDRHRENGDPKDDVNAEQRVVAFAEPKGEVVAASTLPVTGISTTTTAPTPSALVLHDIADGELGDQQHEGDPMK
jgi:hypothetical protein